MAVVSWVGKQIAKPWKKTLTVATADTGGTITLTGGNSQAVAVTPTTTNTTTTASEIATALAAAGGVFSDLTVTSSGAVVTLVGPSDGAPVTFSKADGGTNSTSLATVDSPTSPHDLNDPVNYSTGALPVDATDSLLFENSAVDAKYNADALAAIALVSPGVVRRATYTGRLGLPSTNDSGYPEYRATYFQWKATGMLWEASDQDQPGQFRTQAMHGSATTVTITGPASNAQIGGESLEIYGLPASSVVTMTGGSLALSPLQGQSCPVATLSALNATVSVGASATLSGTVRLDNCTARIRTSWTTSVTVDGQSQVEIGGSAAGVLVIDGGTVYWRSTGNPGNSPIIGSGAVLDLETAPASLTIGGTIALYAGGALLDGAGRGGNYAVQLVRATMAEVTWRTVSNKTFTLS